MGRFSSAAMFAATVIASRALALEHVDTERAVAEFLAATETLPQSEWMGAWEKLEREFQPFYDLMVFDRTRPDWQIRRSEKLARSFADLPRLRPAMKELNARQRRFIAESEAGFQAVFPNARLNTRVFFLPGLSFNGKVNDDASGSTVLGVGIDVCAKLDSSIPVLMAHELFHVHHFDAAGRLADTFARPLWSEGFATYASGVLTGSTGPAALLMDERLAQACADPILIRGWSEEYLRVFDLPLAEANEEHYRAWFSAGAALPYTRRGYCVGYHVAKALAERESLEALTRWTDADFLPEVRAELQRLATDG